MRLSSVRALKEELLSDPNSVASVVSEASPFRPFSTRRGDARDAASRTMEDIALGLFPLKRGQFRLAVRLQRKGPLTRAVLEEIVKKTKGEVDVREIGSIVKYQSPASPAYYQTARRPLKIGSSIGDKPPGAYVTAGTLGCFVEGRSKPFYIGMLSNNHVIGGENATPLGSDIAQPGTLDGGVFPNDVVGGLWKRSKLSTSTPNLVDAAVAHIFEEIDYDARTIGTLGSLLGLGDVAHLPPQAPVFKVGRTTGQTEGRITAFDVDNLHIDYGIGLLRFDSQIEIEGSGKDAFSDSGDSGSLIVDDQLRAVGLLFAGGDIGGENGKGLTYANPIGTVLDKLKVDMHL